MAPTKDLREWIALLDAGIRAEHGLGDAAEKDPAEEDSPVNPLWIKRDVTLDRRVYTFKTEFETAMVSCAEDGSDAFIATYFWHEPANYVNEVTPDTGTNPNLA